MADSGARANVGVSKVRGRIPRLGLSRGSQTDALAARIEKRQAEMQFCDMGESTHHSNEDIMAPSDQQEKYDVREMTGMVGSFPPPPRNNTKIDVMYKMMGVLSEKMEALSKEEAVQAEKRVALDEKMKTLSKEESIQAEKRVVLNQKMDLLSKLLDAMS